MSTERAMESVSITLFQVLDEPIRREIQGSEVTLLPIDIARKNRTTDQLNLFLYQTTVNAGWSNSDLPLATRPNETGRPPLALDLHYLLTAYGKDDQDERAHRMLGMAMSLLHDHPVLGRNEMAVPESGVAAQVERIRITPQPLSVDELSKLWTAFKAEYRLSAAYWASVVLIDSRLAGRAPLPVLQRGQEDQGALVGADVVPPFAALTGLQPPKDQLDLRPGDTLTLLGHHLDSGDLTVRFRHLGLDQTVDVPPDADGRFFDTLTVTLAPQGEWDWPAGFYSVALGVAGDDDHQTGDALGVAVVPAIQDIQPDPADLDPDGRVELTVTCGPPEVRTDQRVALLLGGHETRHQRIDGATTQLSFALRGARPGTYRARLRVDGATSRFIDHTETPPRFVGRQVRLRDAGT